MSVNPTPTIVNKGTKYECIEWHLPNGKLHREDGPAVEYANGTKAWYVNGILHREDGPAVIYPDGTKAYWINGDRYTEEEFKQVMNTNRNNSAKDKM